MIKEIELQELHVLDLKKLKEIVDQVSNMLAKIKLEIDKKEIAIIKFDISKHCLELTEKTQKLSNELTNAYYRQLGILTEMKLKSKFGE